MEALSSQVPPSGGGECPNPLHVSCFKYATLTSFDEPWQAMASILCYMRAGYSPDVPDKAAHQRIPGASDAEMADVRDEMPEELFSDELVLELEGDG